MTRLASTIMLAILLMPVLMMLDGPQSRAAAPHSAREGESLFTDIVTRGNLVTVEDPTVVRARFADVNFDLLDVGGRPSRPKPDTANVLRLNLFKHVGFACIIDRVESTPPGSVSWIGHLDGVESSQVVLVVRDGMMAGNITLPEAFYQVRYAGNGVHAIYEIDQSAFPSEAEPIPVETPHDAEASSTTIMADDGSSIDVLVVYTGAALSGTGGAANMNLIIDLAVSVTNTSYGNSGINQRVRVVHREEVAYSESGFNWNTTLSRLKHPLDGYMDNVHTLRDTYRADAVVLIVNDITYCGIGYLMTNDSLSFEPWAFAVVSLNCAIGHYSFAHELGHIMGARHDWYVDYTNTYRHGYVNTDGGWRTIMAYNTECDDNGFYCARLQYWSNPNNTYDGEPMGVPESSLHEADNRKTLNTTAYTVANFRSSAEPSPELDIKANGSDGPIIVPPDDLVSITVSLDPRDLAGQSADWWVVGFTHSGTYWFKPSQGWIESDIPVPAGQWPLFDLSDYSCPSIQLPEGVHTFYFVLDDTPDGTLGVTWFDYVTVANFSSSAEPSPELDIKANGSDGPVIIRPDDPVSITLSLDPRDLAGQSADWWIVGFTHFGTYWFKPSQGWIKSDIPVPAGQWPLFDLSAYSCRSIQLPEGLYTFYFVLDNTPDGTLGVTWFDYVNVIGKP